MMQLSESDFLKNMHREDMLVEEREGDITLTMKKKNNLNQINKEIDLARKRAEKPAIFSKIILDPSWKPIIIFGFLIIISAMISTTLGAYFACFGEPTDNFLIILDMVMEILFAIDIIRNFFM